MELPSALAHTELWVCPACKACLKKLDRRADPLAMPVVDDLFSSDLDRRALAQGWQRVEPNALPLESPHNPSKAV